MSKKRSNKTRIPPDVAAQYFSHLSSSSSNTSGNNTGNNSSRSNGNPPCSPEEVKALMSMFAEIMGMADSSSGETTTTTTRRSKTTTTTTTSSSSVSFMFGSNSGKDSSPSNWPPNALAAAARAASMYMPPEGFMDYDDDDDEEDDDDDDDDDYNDEDDDEHQQKLSHLMSTSSTDSKGPSTIDPNDWKELEQVANDEVREQQDRARKAAKKREKKQRKKERARQEAALRAAEAAQKKHDKLVTSWKSRVVSAANAGDTSKLNALLKESALKPNDDSNQEHVDFLFPNCVAKTRDGVEKSSECRLKLAEFCVSITASKNSCSIFMSILKSGRSALHSACFVGDYYFVEFVLENITTSNSDDEDDDCNEELIDWNATCRESGFAPIHYAVLSGSDEVLELLMGQEGCNIECKTNAALTNREGKEVTTLDLAKALLDGKQSTIQSSGSAWSEANEYCAEDRFRYHSFLQRTIDRLTHVLRHGYTPLPNAASRKNNQDQRQKDQQDLGGGTSSNNKSRKKKKKKKQQQQQQQQHLQATPAPVLEETPEDPMISALLGMGFSRDQIDRAAEACGGTARATADDLVQWIFAQEAGEEPQAMSAPVEQPPITQADNSMSVPIDNSAKEVEHDHAEAFQKAEESRLAQERLNQKREEQRRRNREWNNREQARQREEVQAKLRARPTYAPAAPTVLTGVNGITGTSLHHLNSSISGEAQLSATTTAPNHTGAPIKILTRAKNTSSEGTIPTVASTNAKKHPPTVVESIGPEFSHVSTATGNFSEDATVSSLGSGMVTAHEWTNEPENISNDGGLAGFQGITAANVASSSAPPPGFQFGGVQTSPETSFAGNEQFVPDTNPTGEIRATARAFVPTSFKPPPGLINNGAPSNSAAATGGVPGSAPYELAPIGKSNNSPATLLNDPVAALLPSSLPQHQNQGFVPMNGFERNPIATSKSFNADSSSMAGIPTTREDHFTANQVQSAELHSGLGLRSLSRGSEAAPISSLLDPLVLQTPSNPEAQAIWGSGNGTNPSIGTSAPVIGSLPSLNEGLPSLSSFGAFDTNSDKNNMTNGATSSGWGDTTASSIW